jgi:adenosylmethionine-8-amino-7-oxononanoate aminotransferase
MRAIAKQLATLSHSTLLGLSHPTAIELGEQLVALAPPGLQRVFYSDSGSTAVEVALKMAFQFHQHGGDTKRQRFLALRNAYHGDTLGSVSVGGIDLFHRLFSPLLFHTERVEPTLSALDSAFAEHGHELAAFVVEPLIQGAAGMLLQPSGFSAASPGAVRSSHGVLLIADEVATGFGRTGTMFACEQVQVSPDFLCVAKGSVGWLLCRWPRR